MRVLAFASILVAGISFAPHPGLAQKCPANANEASSAVWPKGAIRTGKTVTGKHPCGRRITCVGGSQNARGSRSCRWL
jgi:hypothetical protein